MSYNRITWLPDVLRAAGIEVVLYPGWESRGLGTYKPFDPQYVVWHHDASARGDSPGVPAYMARNWENAGAQVWVDRQGRWHIVGSGRAAHAGVVLAGMPDNYNSIGIETDHTTGEDWPPALLESLRKGTAAIFDHWKVPASHLHFHKTICSPPGRKTDPDGLDLETERKRVGAIRVANERKPAPKPKRVSLKRAQRLARTDRWYKAISPANRRTAKIIRDALAAERCDSYRQWQRHLGYRGNDADGVPGHASLTALGKKHGFVVAR